MDGLKKGFHENEVDELVVSLLHSVPILFESNPMLDHWSFDGWSNDFPTRHRSSKTE